MSIFDEVMTIKEASQRWNISLDALRQNCNGRVKSGFLDDEIKKSGGTWLVTRTAMKRLYGREITMLNIIKK